MNAKEINTDRIILWVILLVAAILRFWNLGDSSLTSDELSALSRLQYDGLGDVLRYGVKELDMHPPGVQVFLYAWTLLFGNSAFVVRLPFVLCSLLSIVLVYRIGRLWFNSHAGLVGAALMATLSYTITYGQIARPYAPGLFGALLLLYHLTKILYGDSKPHTKAYLWLLLALVLCMYTHYYCMLFAMLAGGIGLLRTNSVNRRPYVLTCIGAAILFLPALPIFLHQFGEGGGGSGGDSGWLGAPEPRWILDYLFYVFNQSWYLIGFVGGAFLIGWLYGFRHFQLNRYHILGTLFFVLSFGFGFLYSIYKNPILQYSVLLFAFPCLLLVLSSLGAVQRSKFTFWVIGLVLVTGVMTTVFEKSFYSTYRFGVVKELAEYTREWNNEYGSDKITQAISVHNPYYIQYYLDELAPDLIYSDYKTQGYEDLYELKQLVQNSTTPFFLFGWSTIDTPPEVYEIILDKYPGMQHDKQFPIAHFDNQINSRVTLFTREGGWNRTPYWNHEDDLLTEIARSSSDTLETMLIPEFVPLMVESDMEFAGTLSQKVADVGLQQGHYIAASVDAQGLSQAELVVTVMRGDEVIFWRSSRFGHHVKKPNDWETVYFGYEILEHLEPGDEFKAYVWNPNRNEFMLRNFEVNLYYSFERP